MNAVQARELAEKSKLATLDVIQTHIKLAAEKGHYGLVWFDIVTSEVCDYLRSDGYDVELSSTDGNTVIEW